MKHFFVEHDMLRMLMQVLLPAISITNVLKVPQ